MVRKCAIEMGHEKLIAKLSEGDMISREACYHLKCMTMFTNSYRKFVNNNKPVEIDDEQKKVEEIALLETLHFVEESLQSSSLLAPYIKLSDVKRQYCQVLTNLNAEFISVNSTRLKDSLLLENKNLEATPHNKEVFISFKDCLAAALKYAEENNLRSDLNCLLQASRIIRRELLETSQHFNGHLKNDFGNLSSSLQLLINMIVGFTSPTDDDASIHTLTSTVSQIIQFNCAKKRSDTSTYSRHNTNTETPLSIYIALLVHSRTRSRSLVDKLSSLGICISYDRMMSISNSLGNWVCDQFEKDRTVCPRLLRKHVFTTFAVDNIDHNPSSRNAKDSWHGTAISATQHLHAANEGEIRECVPCKKDGSTMKELPATYTTVKPFALKSTDIFAPEVQVCSKVP